MNNFLSGIAVTLSFIALAGSGFAVFRVSQLESSPPTAAVSSSVAPSDSVEPASLSEASPEPVLEEPAVEETDPSDSSSGEQKIQPGQFTQVSHEGQVRVEITAAKRLKTSEGLPDNVVVLELQYRRLVDTVIGNSYINLGKAQARNPETREIYRPASSNKKTSPFFAKKLPTDAWADAFVWLQIPKEIDTVDLVLDQTPIFKGVPISG